MLRKMCTYFFLNSTNLNQILTQYLHMNSHIINQSHKNKETALEPHLTRELIKKNQYKENVSTYQTIYHS